MAFPRFRTAAAAAAAAAAGANRHRHVRTFVNAKVKWIRDPYLDKAVENEKNLKPLHSLKSLIISQPSKTLPLSSAAAANLRLPIAAAKFIGKYPYVFKIFNTPNKHMATPHVKLTQRALALHNDEMLLIGLSSHRRDTAERLSKLLMIAGAMRLPLGLIEKLRFDLGLPCDYLLSFLPEFPEYFRICEIGFEDQVVFGLELVKWRYDLAVSVVEWRAGSDTSMPIRYSMNFPRGFELEKRVRNWVEEWQNLPCISPYENAFHLNPSSDQAEKWTVGVIHEMLNLLVSKKTEKENVYALGDYLGFGVRFKKALVHHPGIFYVSNKISTQTVVLREAYRKSFLIEKHPLIGLRYKYIYLMNLVLRRGVPIHAAAIRHRERLDAIKERKLGARQRRSQRHVKRDNSECREIG